MGENEAGKERMLKQIVSMYRCQHCRRGFEREHVRITARHDQVWLVSVRCSRCRNQQMFCMAMKHSETVTAHDLLEGEEDRFAGMDPVTSDDVLDVHEFLSEFDGNFKRIFNNG